MKVVVTGADGFLGWHLRVRCRALSEHEVFAVNRESWASLSELVAGADAVIHIAGVNRGEPDHVERENVRLAEDLAAALEASPRPRRIVYANSVQSGNGTPYGAGKAAAAEILQSAAERTGASVVDVRLPNLFGEHGRPQYNSFVATFVDLAVTGGEPDIVDRPVPLLHVQDAAEVLLDGLVGEAGVRTPDGTQTSVAAVWERLRSFVATYANGDIPRLDGKLDVDLFNTLRARLFPLVYPIALTEHSDDRGRLVETVRSHGGEGQTFVSTTRPGIARGEHFHLRKIERFVVLSGQARISLRRVLTDDLVDFEVSGERPVVIDMPTLWAHNIINTGDTELVTLFWTNELFDPADPDTHREPVLLEKVLAC
ncbi:NAD-dependent epimerase/dehydratase family protein [Intrasporangium sp. YIM S08009]|uniref:polysaccharide biosynthesis C-terminal domain-containing protein n=1 Tax=Intrasporangium zincisolvens TaxID=3080018 RepID=UPI002B057621|nr:NAD-dependent epimerase/dehydratase family protein [Intrasporangium sp. YIM S08009]